MLLTAASQPASIEELSQVIDRHQAWLGQGQRQQTLREQRARYRIKRVIEACVAQVIARQDSSFFALPIRQQVKRIAALVGAHSGLQPGA